MQICIHVEVQQCVNAQVHIHTYAQLHNYVYMHKRTSKRICIDAYI